jgi:hypothetical protein
MGRGHSVAGGWPTRRRPPRVWRSIGRVPRCQQTVVGCGQPAGCLARSHGGQFVARSNSGAPSCCNTADNARLSQPTPSTRPDQAHRRSCHPDPGRRANRTPPAARGRFSGSGRAMRPERGSNQRRSAGADNTGSTRPAPGRRRRRHASPHTASAARCPRRPAIWSPQPPNTPDPSQTGELAGMPRWCRREPGRGRSPRRCRSSCRPGGGHRQHQVPQSRRTAASTGRHLPSAQRMDNHGYAGWFVVESRPPSAPVCPRRCVRAVPPGALAPISAQLYRPWASRSRT